MEKQVWQSPQYDKMGMTQWFWRVTHRERFILGSNVEIGSFTMIDAQEGVTIEDDVKIGFGCAILSHSSIDNRSGPIKLRKACNVGAHTVVMPGVEIGENATVGANSVAIHNIPANEIWLGSPAKFVRKVK